MNSIMNPTDFSLVGGIPVVVIALVFLAWIGSAGRRRHELDKLRLDVLRQALEHPALDQGTRAELLRVLTRDQDETRRSWIERMSRHASVWRGLWFCISWALFISSTGMLIANELRFVRGLDKSIVFPLAIVGFAMVTMPFAWNELKARRDAVADRRS